MKEHKCEKERENEQVLIRRARKGDVKAFSELYAQIYKELYRFAFFTLKHPQDAEDAVSEAVIAAYENIGRLQKEESFRSWIFTILANRCRSRFKRKEDLTELTEELPAREVDHEEACDVRAAFMMLEEEDRMIVAWSVLGGYLSEEIGSVLEMNAATVRSRKARAMEKMKQALI